MSKKYEILSDDAPDELDEGIDISFHIRVKGCLTEEEARELVEDEMDYEFSDMWYYEKQDCTSILCRYWIYEIDDKITESLRAYMAKQEEEDETNKE